MNELKNLVAFQQVLSAYQPSLEAQKALRDLKLVLLAAPTSTGRNTLIRALLETGTYRYIVSDTTRDPRVNDGVLEQSGKEYWFRSEAEVLAELRAGNYLEAAIIHRQQVSGISMRELEGASREHKVAITDIEVAGVDSIMKVKPDTLAVFMVPPSFQEWQHRLQQRSTMAASEVRRRLQSACRELQIALDRPYYTFVVSEAVPKTMQTIEQLVKQQVNDDEAQDLARALVQKIYEQTKAYIASLQ